MKMEYIISVLFVLIAGIVVTLQGGLNTKLGISLNNSDWATFLTFLIGTILIGIYLIITKQNIPSLDSFIKTPIWAYLGAICGIIYVMTVIYMTPKLGVGTTVIFLLLAQIVTSAVVDHIDLFKLGGKPFDIFRFIGIVLVIIGVILINIPFTKEG